MIPFETRFLIVGLIQIYVAGFSAYHCARYVAAGWMRIQEINEKDRDLCLAATASLIIPWLGLYELTPLFATMRWNGLGIFCRFGALLFSVWMMSEILELNEKLRLNWRDYMALLSPIIGFMLILILGGPR